MESTNPPIGRGGVVAARVPETATNDDEARSNHAVKTTTTDVRIELPPTTESALIGSRRSPRPVPGPNGCRSSRCECEVLALSPCRRRASGRRAGDLHDARLAAVHEDLRDRLRERHDVLLLQPIRRVDP